MKIALTFNARGAGSAQAAGAITSDDAEEEFDSPETIAALADVLRGQGHAVELWGEGEPLLRRLLAGERADLVFNFAEGTGVSRSRESRVPALLEMFNIPYTGSDPLSLAVALDKDCAKRLVAAAGVPTPRWRLIDHQTRDVERVLDELLLPVIVKPAYEGSSKGIRSTSYVDSASQLRAIVAELRGIYQQPILVEEFIDGDELTVGLVGNPPRVLGIMRVLPRVASQAPFVYSLEVKRDFERSVRYETPARLTPAQTKAVEKAALGAWQALSCRDVARIDFRLRGDTPYFLEANPLPGLSPKTSDLVFLAAGMGFSHSQLVATIVEAAVARVFPAGEPGSTRGAVPRPSFRRTLAGKEASPI